MWRPIFPDERAERPTMERLALIDCRAFGVYLHRFPVPGARIPGHDHPWDFATLVLSGGYVEQSCTCGVRGETRARGTVGLRRAESAHAVVVGPAGALTLCVRGPQRRAWSWRRLGAWR
jgi:hypothetical protein